MNAVKDDVIQLVAKELASANEQFPLFASQHEGYAVLLEEVGECKENLEIIESCLSDTWYLVKSNVNQSNTIKDMKKYAIELICEGIQIAAMCEKWEVSFEGAKHE